LAHQFARSYQSDSRSLHPSFDLYGGGGLVSTSADLARFTYLLFEGKLFKDPYSLELILNLPDVAMSKDFNYRLGTMVWQHDGILAFGHGGFWGAMVQFFPDIETAVVVCPMERDYWPEAIELCRNTAQSIRKAH
ncbi:MAG: serine hydrolase, partial [Bacteroidota bacterium]|nr:serine hydrolase [Bacteroidota bacterium]MDX5430360.1 serine hydrolase [Bacteroidota bacterium]MDX5469121.1 serine hydrolase [Bacteroidota bacterium]